MYWIKKNTVLDLAALARCYASASDMIWLDSALVHPKRGRFSYLCLDGLETRAPITGLQDLRAWLARFEAARIETGPPFQGGLVGYFDYEFSDSGLLSDSCFHPDQGRARFRLYDTIVAVDHIEHCSWIICAGISRAEEDARYPAAQQRVSAICSVIDRLAIASDPSPIAVKWERRLSDAAYKQSVEAILDYVRAGDIYQVNFAHAFEGQLPKGTSPFELYFALRHHNPAPFSAFARFGDIGIACTSPERLIAVSPAGNVEARPIKGTIARSFDPRKDRGLKDKLIKSEKDRAENTMIVDLLRNDLSKICEPHSVKVPELCTLETYAGVHQLTSSVQGQLKTGADALDLVAAVFPGGSITGVPKLRAMEIINALEDQTRSAFCGSFGWIGFDGAADFNIMIRTVQIDGERLRLDVGGGITALSDVDDELEETLVKAQKIIDATSMTEAAL